jgi:hypothetical protein
VPVPEVELCVEPELDPPLELDPTAEIDPPLELEPTAEIDPPLELEPALDPGVPPVEPEAPLELPLLEPAEPVLLEPLLRPPAPVALPLLPPAPTGAWQIPSSPHDKPAGHAWVLQLEIVGTGTVQPARLASSPTHPKRLTTSTPR